MCIRFTSLIDFEAKVATTAWLSHRQWTILPSHAPPQTAAAMRMGMSSLTAIWRSRVRTSHGSWNHAVLDQAAHPHNPDASEWTIRGSRAWVGGAIAIPFHRSANVLHQQKSDWNSLLRWMNRTGWYPMRPRCEALTLSIQGCWGAQNTGGGDFWTPRQRKPTLLPRRLAKRGPHSQMVEMSVEEEHINHKNRAFSYRRVLITKGIRNSKRKRCIPHPCSLVRQSGQNNSSAGRLK